MLSVNAGQVLTFDSLLRQAWFRDNSEPGGPKLVRALVKRLRRKLGDDAANPTYIRNGRGVGYRMANPREASRAGPSQAMDLARSGAPFS